MGLEWLRNNWFNLTQSTGIIGGLLFTGLAIRQNILATRHSQDLALTQRHSELWSEVLRRPELARVVSSEVDLVAQPVTTAEEEYLNLVFIHFQTSWNLAAAGAVLNLQTLKLDAGHFFRLPVPNRVWRQMRGRYASEFVAFIDAALAAV